MLKIETDIKEGYVKATVKGDAPQIITEIALSLRNIYEEMAKDGEAGYLFKNFVEDGVLDAIIIGSEEEVMEVVARSIVKDKKDVQH